MDFAPDATVYQLSQKCDRGNPRDLVRRIDPLYLNIANAIILDAKNTFGQVDTSILIPLADHIAFAAQRIQKSAPIGNPLTQDIKALFPDEFQVARRGGDLIAGADRPPVQRRRAGLHCPAHPLPLWIHAGLPGDADVGHHPHLCGAGFSRLPV